MIITQPTGVMDLFTVFVVYVFGSFWLAVIGIILLLFIIMGVLGRMSVYSVGWYCVMFLMIMALGYGFSFASVIIGIALFVGAYFSGKGYIDRGGQ